MASRQSGPRWWRQRGGHNWERGGVSMDQGRGAHVTRSDDEQNGADGVACLRFPSSARALPLGEKQRRWRRWGMTCGPHLSAVGGKRRFPLRRHARKIRCTALGRPAGLGLWLRWAEMAFFYQEFLPRFFYFTFYFSSYFLTIAWSLYVSVMC
jgi:hypothetical protein